MTHLRMPLTERLKPYQASLTQPVQPLVEGRLTRMVGLTLEAVGCRIATGQRCMVVADDNTQVEAEVMGFAGDKLFLMPLTSAEGIHPGAKVIPMASETLVPVGSGLLGRILGGLGKPLDGLGPLDVEDYVELYGPMINPLSRQPIKEPLDVGIRAINGVLTVGRGQRLGLFAGSGVGKSVLLGMMTRFTAADIIVVALVGERGREVKEFIDHTLGEAGLARSVVVASPADDSPLVRLRAAMLATRIAEHFRDQGKSVLLLMDSLTRYAQAQREIALAIGEPPATKGYPPSVFAKLPQLVERAGNGAQGSGSITAFYTVLAEGDDQQDPIADASRAILDGHLVLSRHLADAGHYPAIDIEASISRAMPAIVKTSHLTSAQRLKQLVSAFEKNRDLINIGAYTQGSDVVTDEAISRRAQLERYLTQGLNEQATLADSISQLEQLLSTPMG
ncbi:flagellar protein export ATPase FliI [Spartinivicinus marinus]